MRKLLFVAIALAIINVSCQASKRMLNAESLTNSDNSIEYFRRLNADNNIRHQQEDPKPAVSPKNNSVKPKVSVKTNVGVAASHTSSKTLQKAAKKELAKKQAALKVKVVESQRNNKQKGIKLSGEKRKIRGEIRDFRTKMRNQRKARDDAKLKKDADGFTKANTKVASLKAKIAADKKNLRQVNMDMKQTTATMKDNKNTLEKITGKKQGNTHRRSRSQTRRIDNIRKIRIRSKKIFALENRMARTISFMRFAKKQKGSMSSVFLKHLQKRAHRLATRLHRKHKELMRVLIRKHRTHPQFKEIYTKSAKRVFALSKADAPIAMTRVQKEQVMALKAKIMALFGKHQKLVGKKSKIRFKIRHARAKISDRKQTRKEAKENVKKVAKVPVKNKNDVKKVKAAVKEADKRKFKMRIAKMNRKALKEHRHNLRNQDRAVMTGIKKIQATIFKMSGVHVKRPSVASQLTLARLNQIRENRTNKIKRANKKLKHAYFQQKSARAMKNQKNIKKSEKRVKKFKDQIMRRTIRLNNFRHKMLNNKDAKTDKKVNKKLAKKENKYKAKKTYVTKRVTTHRKKNLNKQNQKNDLRQAEKAIKKTAKATSLPIVAKPTTPAMPKTTTKATGKAKVTVKAPAKAVSQPKVTTTKAPTPTREIEANNKKTADIKGLDSIINKEDNKDANDAKKQLDNIPTA